MHGGRCRRLKSLIPDHAVCLSNGKRTFVWMWNIPYLFHCRTFSTVIWCPTQSVSWKPDWSPNWKPSQFVLRCLMRTAWSTSTPGRGWSRNPTCQSGADLSDPRPQEAYPSHQVRKRNLSFRGRHSWKKSWYTLNRYPTFSLQAFFIRFLQNQVILPRE